MANYGMLREYQFVDAAEDIRGSKLYGIDDEKLGKIDDVIFDYATGVIRYVVVDTGGWLQTKQFIVPGNRLRASAKHDDDFEVSLTKAQVEAFPPYNQQDLESDEQWSNYEVRYRSKWEADPVMHRAGTDRNITPTPQQMEGNLNSEMASGSPEAAKRKLASTNAADAEPVEIGDTEMIEPGFAAGTSTVEIQNSAVGIGGRWDTFQDRLRERRKEVINTGSTSESAYRKAS
jgi:sporulation protein YlmC with PRC-barrel domain